MGKYKGLLDDIKATQAAGSAPAPEPLPPSPAPDTVVEKRKVGRPKVGKSSNPEFVQITAYVEESVHRATKKALLDTRGTDLSDLVNDLLKKWVKSRG